MYHLQNLDKKQKAKFLQKTRTLVLKIQKPNSPSHECNCCQPKDKKIAQEGIRKDKESRNQYESNNFETRAN